MGDIAASWVLQVGNQSHPRLRSPLLDRIADVVESRWKCFESFRIIYISDSRILLLLSPFVALVRPPDVEVLTFLSSNFTIFLGSCGYLGIVLMVLWWEHSSWCLLTFRGCGSVPGSWAPRCCRHNFIVAILEYLSFADIEKLFYAVVGEITSTPPNIGAGVREYRHNSYNGCFFEGWGKWFPKVSWLCVEGWIQLDVGFASFGWDIMLPLYTQHLIA